VTPTEARNARLTALKTATTQWADNQTKLLNDQVTFAKRILRGRTGAERLTSTAVGLGKDVVVDEINTFLTG
jgi:hypothetical protein